MSIKKSKYFLEEDNIETVSEVSDSVYKPLPLNKDLKIIGKKIPRYDGYQKVSGKAKYTFDLKFPDMAHAKILRSHVPNAIIKNIDVTSAKKMKGVLDVLTFKDVESIGWYGENSKLLDNHVRYEGDEIAFVVAESENIANEAIKKIKVDKEELAFTITAEESMKADSYQNYDWGNITNGKPDEYERGDINEGFKTSDIIVEDTYTTQVVIHNPTEVHCSVVKWDGDIVTVWDSTQGVFTVRESVADALNMSEEKVRVIKEFMGGGFGSKLEAGKYTVLAAIASRKLQRPVKIVLNRKEMNLAVGNRPDSVQKLKVGVKKNGQLMAISHEAKASVGAYPTGGGCSWPVRSLYKCENVKTKDYSVITNTGKARPFRAPGHVQGTFAFDSIIDDAAEKIGMDPLEFRLKNYAENDQVWGLKYTSKLLKEAYLAGAEKIEWDKRNKIPGSDKRFVKKGIGMASQIWWGGGGPPAYVRIEVNKKGEITAFSGTQDLGTGTYTFISQIVSELLEVDIDKIKVIIGDTGRTPYAPSSGGSTTAPSVSPATRDACEKLKKKFISSASVIMNEEESNLHYSQGVVSTKDSTNSLKLSHIVEKLKNGSIYSEGAREENKEGFIIQSFGAQFAKVAVDTLTGNVKVEKIVAAHDIGRTLNRQTLENQFHGGIIQGLGYALMEERILDADYGRVLNPNMHEYKMPTVLDVPEIEVIIVSENDDKANNMGVKGIGEPAIIPTAAAIANAVYNAIGVRIKSLPITPDKVLNSLNV